MKNNIVYLLGLFIAMLGFTSCKKESAGGSSTKAVFSYVSDGYVVTFTNFSNNAKTYNWDFGDGSGITSTAKTPQHIFHKKGDFLVSLTVKNDKDSSTFKDTVTIIGPNIVINGDFSDWQYVDYSFTNVPGTGGTITAMKTFASANMINFYFEGTSDMKMNLFDMYIDADNNPATGFSTWMYPGGSGAEFLAEGGINGGSLYAHSGDPSAFSFSPVIDFGQVIAFSPVKSVGGKNIIEFSIKKSALGTIKTAVNFCFIELDPGYSEVGSIPASKQPGAVFSRIDL